MKLISSILGLLLFSTSVFAGDSSPLCIGDNQPLPVINEQVLQWKKTTPNSFKKRGHIEGVLTKIYPNKTGHVHIQVQIGQERFETIEVIYNTKFGKVGAMQIGSTVEACGDYITSNKRTGRYKPSPDGAIIHWVHRSNNDHHESGYMMIDGVVYGGEQNLYQYELPELIH
jgi:hypothetical protein